jgi:hypothetical protein
VGLTGVHKSALSFKGFTYYGSWVLPLISKSDKFLLNYLNSHFISPLFSLGGIVFNCMSTRTSTHTTSLGTLPACFITIIETTETTITTIDKTTSSINHEPTAPSTYAIETRVPGT